MRAVKSFCAVAIASFALSISLISPARADHEGPYVIGQTRYINNLWACETLTPMTSALAALSNEDEDLAVNILKKSTACSIINISSADGINVKVIGQIGEDVSQGGHLNRIVHVKTVTEGEDLYLFVYGNRTKVVMP